MMATPVKYGCPPCRTMVTVMVEDIAIMLPDTKGGWPRFAATCPRCAHIHVTLLDQRVALAVVKAYVTSGRKPVRLPQRPPTLELPTLTLDDLIDLHEELEGSQQ